MKKLSKIAAAAAIVLTAVFAAGCSKTTKINGVNMETLKLDSKWDKTFKLDESVSHKKVTFTNHFGITLAADMYMPKVVSTGGILSLSKGSTTAKSGSTTGSKKLPAIAVCGPFGAVKEQSSGLYAHEMAKRGFITIAFDPSFCGESGGNVRYMNSPDINTEDFQAAVDFLSVQENVDPEKIGIIGICGWGGMALNTAAIDTRIKATAAITMYDMTRIAANGYFDSTDSEEARYEQRVALNKQRTEDYKNGTYKNGGGLPDERPAEEGFFQQYWDYYKTERGYHPRSLNSNMGWNASAGTSLLNTKLLAYTNEIRNAVLVVHGEKAHSRYFGETAFNNMIKDSKYTSNKELMIIPEATHCDLYDGGKGNYIPWEKLQEFFESNLK